MVHDSAAVGYERESRTYARARPSYHPVVLDALVPALPSGLVIDLGAGTGISTAALLERGLDVLAVEPVDAMREALSDSLPHANVVRGTAESLPVEDSSIAAVVVAQAFHWFNHAAALTEIARALQPGGLLVTLWNVRDESVPWMAAYSAVQHEVQGDTPRWRDMVWRTSIEDDARFGLVAEFHEPNPQPSNADHTVERFLSTSFIARLDPEMQAQLETAIREIVQPLGDVFEFPYITQAQLWRLLDENQ